MKITMEPTDLPEAEIIIRGNVTDPQILSVLQFLNQKENRSKLMVFAEEEQVILDYSDIVFIETSANKILVYTKSDTYEARQKLYELKEQLPSRNFAQINKSVLVNINCVRSIQAEFSGNYRLKLKNRKESLTISRKYFKEFKDKI